MRTAEQTRTLHVNIRWLIRRDMQRVLDIEQRSFPRPWAEEDFLRQLRQRNCIGMVAEKYAGEEVYGYMLYELHEHHIEAVSLAVDPAYHRRGVGRDMVEKLKSKLSAHRRTRLVVPVGEDNLGAQLFLKAQGLLAVKVLRDYYDDGDSAYIFEHQIPGDDLP